MANTVDYALTTLSRVKDRQNITISDHDDTIKRMINTATDLIERYCNRRFKEQTLTNEVYTIKANRNNQLVLKQAPVSSIIDVEERIGNPDNPNWTSMLTSNYILDEDGKSGILNLLGGVVTGKSILRVSYTAGYKIDFDNAGDPSLHELPHEITDESETIEITLFKRKDGDHTRRENTGGGSSSDYKGLLQEIDRNILDSYVRQRIV